MTHMSSVRKQNFIVVSFAVLLGILLVFLPVSTRAEDRPSNSRAEVANVNIEDRLDILYGSESHQTLDLYLPNASGPHPVVVFAHDMLKAGSDKRSIPSVVRELTKLGWAVASINYRMGVDRSDVMAPEMSVYDFIEATRWLQRNSAKYHLDKDVFVASGEGIGGQMAFMAAGTQIHNSGAIYSGIFTLAAPLDMVAIYENKKEVLAYVPLILCPVKPCSTETLKKGSPTYLISNNTPPVYIINGENDVVVDASQIERFEQKYITTSRLGAEGIWVDIVRGEDHALDDANFNTDQLKIYFSYVLQNR